MKTQVAYHGSKELKSKIIAELLKHQQKDRIIQKTYGRIGSDGVWRGCDIGCTLRSIGKINNIEIDNFSDHEKVEEETGVPLIILRLKDRIFEGLPKDKASQFVIDSWDAIEPGKDLSKVWHKFAQWLMIDPVHGVLRFAKSDPVRESINRVGDMYSDYGSYSQEDWRYAAAAGRCAAEAAEAGSCAAAAEAAAAAGRCAAEAEAAVAAVAAGRCAAAAAAAAAAGIYTQYMSEAEKLIELLKTA